MGASWWGFPSTRTGAKIHGLPRFVTSGDRSGLPVHFINEEYSSAEAEARIRSIGLTRKQKEDKGRIDAAAAAIILQDWLDTHPLDEPSPVDERRD